MKIGYARVSTTGQNLEAQSAALGGAGVEKLCQDKAPGKDRVRPALKEMLSFAREGDESLSPVLTGSHARVLTFTRSSPT